MNGLLPGDYNKVKRFLILGPDIPYNCWVTGFGREKEIVYHVYSEKGVTYVKRRDKDEDGDVEYNALAWFQWRFDEAFVQSTPYLTVHDFVFVHERYAPGLHGMFAPYRADGDYVWQLKDRNLIVTARNHEHRLAAYYPEGSIFESQGPDWEPRGNRAALHVSDDILPFLDHLVVSWVVMAHEMRTMFADENPLTGILFDPKQVAAVKKEEGGVAVKDERMDGGLSDAAPEKPVWDPRADEQRLVYLYGGRFRKDTFRQPVVPFGHQVFDERGKVIVTPAGSSGFL